ncbi:MFS transporter [Corynebacterium hansenii]|uniref:MFS transporter n=1 Tax=Corynebacterium hansenii TaxID=394964 RepID=A0ABV7ZN63_9CORY|nr:MFS transporter [Corynebacterium hansenii]WJZ01278.1 Major Facilitator Superfamily protein [Corynebacterium hansenii]
MKRWFAMLVAVTVVGQAVFNGGRVLLSYRVLDFGGDAVMIGAFTAAFSLVPLLIALRAGRLVDDGHAPAVMRAGLIATVAATALMAWSEGLGLLLVGYVALGFAHMTSLIAAQGMVSKLRGTTSGLDSLFAYFTLGISVGQLLGIALSGWIAAGGQGDGRVNTTPALLGLTALGAVALVAGWPVASAFRRLVPAVEQPAEGAPAHYPVRRMLGLPGMPAAMGASVAVIVAIDLMTAYMPVLGHEIGLSVGEVTMILGARSGMGVVSRALMPWALAHVDRDRVLVAMIAAGAVPLVATPWLNGAWMLAIATGICGFAWGFVMPMTMTWVSSLVPPADKAMALSVRLMGNRLAQVALPAGAGALASATGVATVFVLSGLMLGATAVGAGQSLTGRRRLRGLR